MIDLTGHTAVVTGGASGIGRTIADQLHECGAAVAVLDVQPLPETNTHGDTDADNGDGTSDGSANAGELLHVFADVTDPTSVVEAVATVTRALGSPTIAVANAGIASVGTATNTSLEEWNRVLAVNLTGAWALAAAVVPAMQSVRQGAIVNIASSSGLVGMRATAAYSAAKAGVVGLTRQMAADFARDNIRVNAISPGVTRTPMLEEMYARVAAASSSSTSVEDRIAAEVRNYPLRRLGEPADIAAAVAFLASDAASWITGAILPVDGGYTAV